MDFYRTRTAVDYPRIQAPCGCVRDEGVTTLPLAMAYVPRQSWGQVYDERVALERGTIFPELDMPFLGAGRHCMMGGTCR